MIEVDIRQRGLREADERLAGLSSPEATRVLRRAMLTVARPIVDRARANIARIEHGSGALHHAIGMRFKAGARPAPVANLPALGGRFSVEIAPRRSDRVALALYRMFYKRRTRGVAYGHLIEFGYTARSGKRVPAQPFLLPALRAGSAGIVARLANELHQGIDRLLRRRR